MEEFRLYETAGRQANAVIRLSRPVKSVRETDFLGKPLHELGKIEVRDDGIHLQIPPWKIVNLRVRLKE